METKNPASDLLPTFRRSGQGRCQLGVRSASHDLGGFGLLNPRQSPFLYGHVDNQPIRGATRDVLWLTFRQGARLAIVESVAGVGAALILRKIMASIL